MATGCSGAAGAGAVPPQFQNWTGADYAGEVIKRVALVAISYYATILVANMVGFPTVGLVVATIGLTIDTIRIMNLVWYAFESSAPRGTEGPSPSGPRWSTMSSEKAALVKEIGPFETKHELQVAWRKWAVTHHPDKAAPGLKAGHPDFDRADAAFKRITSAKEAYELKYFR